MTSRPAPRRASSASAHSRPTNIHVPPNPYASLSKVSQSGYSTPASLRSPRMPKTPLVAPTPTRRASRSVPASPALSPRNSIFADTSEDDDHHRSHPQRGVSQSSRPSFSANRPSSPLGRSPSSFFGQAAPLDSPTDLEDGQQYLHSPSTFGLLHPSSSEIGLGITTPTFNSYSFPSLSPSFTSTPSMGGTNGNGILPTANASNSGPTGTGSRPGQARRVSRMEEKESALATKRHLTHHQVQHSNSSFAGKARNMLWMVWSWCSFERWLGQGIATRWADEVWSVIWPGLVCYSFINLAYSW